MDWGLGMRLSFATSVFDTRKIIVWESLLVLQTLDAAKLEVRTKALDQDCSLP